MDAKYYLVPTSNKHMPHYALIAPHGTVWVGEVLIDVINAYNRGLHHPLLRLQRGGVHGVLSKKRKRSQYKGAMAVRLTERQVQRLNESGKTIYQVSRGDVPPQINIEAVVTRQGV